MGRMLETLRTGGTRMITPESVVDWSLREEAEIPYIEVGAGKKVEGSAQVMAVKHPPRPLQPPHVQAAPAPPEPLPTPAPREPRSAERSPPAAAEPHYVTKKPPSVPVIPEAVAAPVMLVTEPKPLSVAFEAWPAGPHPARSVAPEVIAFHQPNHPISQQYASLLEKMLDVQKGAGPKALLLCGGQARLGTTTVVLNLGVAAAQRKYQTVLIDAHLARPTLAQRLGLLPSAGLQEAIGGQAALESTVVKTPIPGLHLLAARAEDNAAVGHFSAEALLWLLAWQKERFDLVLLDGPSLEETADLATLAPQCDGVYLVVPQGQSPQPWRAMAQNLARQGGRLQGLIHTHFEM